MKQYVGQYILFRVNQSAHFGHVYGGVVQLLSPSGLFARIGWTWYAVSDVSVLESVPPSLLEDPLAAPIHEAAQAETDSLPRIAVALEQIAGWYPQRDLPLPPPGLPTRPEPAQAGPSENPKS